MTTYRFNEISTKRTRRWIDENGKKRQETQKFSQTLNPFNQNPDGTLKTAEQIEVEINRDADAWALRSLGSSCDS